MPYHPITSHKFPKTLFNPRLGSSTTHIGTPLNFHWIPHLIISTNFFINRKHHYFELFFQLNSLRSHETQYQNLPSIKF